MSNDNSDPKTPPQHGLISLRTKSDAISPSSPMMFDSFISGDCSSQKQDESDLFRPQGLKHDFKRRKKQSGVQTSLESYDYYEPRSSGEGRSTNRRRGKKGLKKYCTFSAPNYEENYGYHSRSENEDGVFESKPPVYSFTSFEDEVEEENFNQFLQPPSLLVSFRSYEINESPTLSESPEPIEIGDLVIPPFKPKNDPNSPTSNSELFKQFSDAKNFENLSPPIKWLCLQYVDEPWDDASYQRLNQIYKNFHEAVFLYADEFRKGGKEVRRIMDLIQAFLKRGFHSIQEDDIRRGHQPRKVPHHFQLEDQDEVHFKEIEIHQNLLEEADLLHKPSPVARNYSEMISPANSQLTPRTPYVPTSTIGIQQPQAQNEERKDDLILIQNGEIKTEIDTEEKRTVLRYLRSRLMLGSRKKFIKMYNSVSDDELLETIKELNNNDEVAQKLQQTSSKKSDFLNFGILMIEGSNDLDIDKCEGDFCDMKKKEIRKSLEEGLIEEIAQRYDIQNLRFSIDLVVSGSITVLIRFNPSDGTNDISEEGVHQLLVDFFTKRTEKRRTPPTSGHGQEDDVYEKYDENGEEQTDDQNENDPMKEKEGLENVIEETYTKTYICANPPGLAESKIICFQDFGLQTLTQIDLLNQIIKMRAELDFDIHDYFNIFIGEGFGLLIALVLQLNINIQDLVTALKHFHKSLFQITFDELSESLKTLVRSSFKDAFGDNNSINIDGLYILNEEKYFDEMNEHYQISEDTFVEKIASYLKTEASDLKEFYENHSEDTDIGFYIFCKLAIMPLQIFDNLEDCKEDEEKTEENSTQSIPNNFIPVQILLINGFQSKFRSEDPESYFDNFRSSPLNNDQFRNEERKQTVSESSSNSVDISLTDRDQLRFDSPPPPRTPPSRQISNPRNVKDGDDFYSHLKCAQQKALMVMLSPRLPAELGETFYFFSSEETDQDTFEELLQQFHLSEDCITSQNLMVEYRFDCTTFQPVKQSIEQVILDLKEHLMMGVECDYPSPYPNFHPGSPFNERGHDEEKN